MSEPLQGFRRKVACPSCGAAVRFRGATSIVAVCPFCKATLVRDGVNVDFVGKQAELLEDHSPIRIGTEGYHKGDAFTVAGRIQFKYAAGLWNEWYVLFRGSRGGWLSDASGEYSITYLVAPQPVPEFATIKPQHTVEIMGDKSIAGTYVVTHIDEGEVVAGEGELPFRFTTGWKANVVDLRGEGARFASIDYSETPPHIYVGERLPFDAFRFTGLRDPEQPGFTQGTARAFKCAGCGAPIEKHLTTTEVVACGSCGTVTDVAGEVGALVQKNERNMSKHAPLVPLGTVGSWKNVRYEVVGFLRRGVTVDGELYEWSEYLLHNVERGYAWLTEYNGHFNFVHAAAEIPKPGKSVGKLTMRYLGRTFTHFQKAEAQVTHLAGEFYWRVQLGEQAICDDYVDPPLILSSEITGKEMSWSLGEYAQPAQVWKAFGLKSKPPVPVGVAANQPSPYKGQAGRYWRAFLAFVALGLALQFVFWVAQPSKRHPMTFAVAPGPQATRAVSPVFELGGWAASPTTVRIASTANRDWLNVDLKLTNADTGQAFGLRRQLGYQKVGGSMEGSSDDVAEIDGVPRGRYTLAIDARSPQPVRGTVEVYRSRLGWSNFWLFSGFLLLWPIVAGVRSLSFETKRWSESDYAPQVSSSSDDDDDD